MEGPWCRTSTRAPKELATPSAGPSTAPAYCVRTAAGGRRVRGSRLLDRRPPHYRCPAVPGLSDSARAILMARGSSVLPSGTKPGTKPLLFPRRKWLKYWHFWRSQDNREMDSNSRSRCEEQRRRSAPLRTGIRPSRYGSTRGPYYGSNSPGEPCSGGGRCAHFADRVPRPKVTLAANSARPRPGRSEVEASTGLDESAGR